jgi:hypothetical protein
MNYWARSIWALSLGLIAGCDTGVRALDFISKQFMATYNIDSTRGLDSTTPILQQNTDQGALQEQVITALPTRRTEKRCSVLIMQEPPKPETNGLFVLIVWR